MPQADMHIHVSCPDWSTLSDPVKSLINFYLKDSRMYFKGSFTGSTLDALYGCIRPTYKTIVEMVGDSDAFGSQDAVELYIPYTVDTASSSATYPLPTDNYVPEFPLTLIEKETRLRLYWLKNAGEYPDEYKQANVYHSDSSTTAAVEPVENVRVILTPKIGTATSSNPDATIQAITASSQNLSRGITSEHGFDCDYQLRTSSLFIDDGNGNIAQNIFYKVGIVPFSKQYGKFGTGSPVNTPSTVEGLTTTLLSERLYFRTDTTYMVGSDIYLALLGVDFAVGEQWSNDYEFWDSQIPLSFIVPIKNGNDKFVGLLYARMFKQNGDEVTSDDVSGYSIKLYYKSSEDDPNPQEVSSSGVATQPVIFTNQSMSGGWVQSPTND